MNREEVIQIVQKLLKTNILDGTGLSQVWDYLKQPVTLADFLGWEEGVEYRRGGNVLKVEDNHLLDKTPNGKFYNAHCSTAELIDLRNATKYVPKYYAKIKGWELIENSKIMYWNLDSEERDVFLSICGTNSRYHAILTKKEWAELGITDENADFEEVEE